MPYGVNHVERFEHGGGTLVDEVTGEATSRHIVFLHGWGATRESLRGIGALFEATHCVHLLDLPGFGDAPHPPSDWDTLNYTDLVERYLDDRLQGAAVIVGHSFGGRIGVRLAARRSSMVRGLVLIGVPGLPATTWSRARIRRSAIRLLRQTLTALRPLTGGRTLKWHTSRFGSADYLAAGALQPVLVRVVNEDLTETATAITSPTLLLWGSDDRESAPSLARRYQQLMNGRPQLEILPHKDHYLYRGTGAHLCAYTIRSWLALHVES